MCELPNYDKVCVVQRNKQTGCIPSAIEWMLRYLKIKGIDFNGFQEKYDLIYQGKGMNTGGEISKQIMMDCPEISIVCQDFDSGREKTDMIKHLINEGTPVLLSIALQREGGWHIVPVVEVEDDKMIVLWMDAGVIDQQKKEFKCLDIENRHDTWNGGTDLIYTKKR